MSVLEVKNLEVGFPQKPLISDLSFKINEPSFVAVIGHNGCGKTTFFRSLIKQHSYRGEIFIHQKELHSIKGLPHSGVITMLEQKNHVNFSIPVKELVAMGRFRKKTFFRNYDRQDTDAAIKALDLLQLSACAEEDFLSLSGGEQQLVWLAQVMLQDTGIILLDEPTQSLDVHNKRKVFDLMKRWVKEEGKTVLCITHDIGNLFAMEGFVLNLAVKSPRLEPLTEESVKNHLRILEEKKQYV